MQQIRQMKHITWVVLLVILAGLGGIALGQGTSASLTGLVSDPSGAAIPGATVTITNTDTNYSQTVQTDGTGVYLFRPLPPGPYRLAINAGGFEKYLQSGIVLSTSLAATQDVHLTVGGANAETVNVTANAELINTTSAELGTSVNEAAISQLPLNGRDPSSLVLLAPGTSNVLQHGGEGIQSGMSFATETGASSNGGRQGSTFYMLDGVSNMDNYNLLTSPFPNSDATQEFRVITNNFSAIYGFAPGAVVSIATKSGTNQFHGGVFEFVRNNDLNAGNWFSGQVDPLKRNQFGGYVGGPVLRDKLFFFGNYQGTRIVEASNTNLTYTPTTAMLNGDFSGIPFALNGPFETIGGKTNQLMPGVSLDSAAVAITNDGLPGHSSSVTQGADGSMYYPGATIRNNYDEGTGRLDYNLKKNQILTLRSFTDTFTQPSGDVPGDILSVLNLSNWSYSFMERMEYYNDVLSHTWTISPSLVNTASVFWSEMSAHNAAQVLDNSGQPMCFSRYIDVTELPGQCYMEGFTVGGNGFNGGWTEPSQEDRNTYGVSDIIIKTLNRHTISTGFNLQHQFAEEYTQYPTQPIITFNGQYTGSGLADFLLGYMSQYEQGAGEIADISGWQVGPFVQDEFRLRPNLTLNVGLRWDPNLAPTSAGGRGAAFVPGQQSTVFPNAPVGLIFPGDTNMTSALMPNSYGYWQPRVGISWQPHNLPRTVFHAGFGMFTGPLEYSSYNHAADVAPFSPLYTLYGNNSSCVGASACTPNTGQTLTGMLNFNAPWSNFAGTNDVSPFPPFASVGYKPPTDSTFSTPMTVDQSFSRNFKLPITQSWNVSIEQQLSASMVFRLAYVGSESYHMSNAIDQNAGIYSVANPTGTRPYSSFAQVLVDQSAATASYHSLQATFERHFSHGFQLQSNFTWSKAIDIAASSNVSFGTPYLPDPFDLRFNRGVSSLDVPINSVTNFIYESPSLKGKSTLLREILGSWEFSGIVTAQSGNPFTIGAGSYDNNSGSLQYQDRADRVPGQSLGVRQGSRTQWLNKYFNTAAFAPNTPGTFGNSGKNIMFGPHVFTSDAAVMKNWTLPESLRLQFRWEAFNATNHPSFGTPDTGLTDGSFGKITAIGNIPPRVMQAALKLTF